ncbi:hydroxy monocarboxylic acid anion dehydrogenase [Tanacetum coccineum]
MEPSSNHNGNSDTVVKDLTNDARVCRNELGLVVEDSVKAVDEASSVALVSSVANRSSDSEVDIRGELLESKNGSVTIEPCFKEGGDDVRVSGNETRSDALVSSVANRSGEKEVEVMGELLESKSGTVMAEVQDLVTDVRVSGNEKSSGVLDSSGLLNGSDVDGSNGVKIGDELVGLKSGTVMAEVQDLVGVVGVSGNEKSSDVLDSSVLLNGSDVDGGNGVKIGDELVESKSGSVAMEASRDHDRNDVVVVRDIVGDTKVSKDELGSVIGNPEKVIDEMITEAVVSPVALGNGVKIGAELVESKTETPKMEQSSGHDGGGHTVQGSVDDATVSRDEIGAVMENVEKVMDESSSDALASSVPTSNGVKIGSDLLDSETPSSDHDRGGVSGDKSGIVKDENEVNVEEKEGEYKVTDLVWAKVKNYPWWPGQIFDPSAANDKAKKHSNKRAFLVAYFGDQSFAWNKAPNIKHFRKNFDKMEKQSNSKAFHHAVNCALDEAYRRAGFGLACSCLSEEVVSKFKSQVFVNAGITEDASRIDGGDRFSTVANFKPVNAVISLHDLARKDIGGVSRLEALSVKAQLLAYLRWKGYNQFSTQHLEGLDNTLEDDSEGFMEEDKAVEDVKPASVSAKVSSEKIMEDDKMVEDVKLASVIDKLASKKRKLNARESGSRKLQDDGDSVPSKKEKRSMNVTPKESPTVLKKKNKSDKNSGKKEKSSTNVTPKESPSVLKKEKKSEKKSGTKATLEDKGVKVESRNGTADQKATTSSPKKLFKIGDTICKIAKQLSESPTVLQNESQKSEKRKKSKHETA